MADEVFALSPISARATQPHEEDYHAISEAFMETARGRWFLGEYARRNRNADTRMVLDAVARIEESLAVQKQPASDNGSAEALAAVALAVEEARASVSAALHAVATEDRLAPVRKGARVIREISWRWREIGADSRICDLLDSQVAAIETACGEISSTDILAAVNLAFDGVKQRIAAFADSQGTSPATVAKPPVPTPSPEAAASPDDAPGPEAARTGTTEVADAAAAQPAEAIIATADAADAAMADDDAVLERIAFEMAAPDPSDQAFDDAGDFLCESDSGQQDFVTARDIGPDQREAQSAPTFADRATAEAMAPAPPEPPPVNPPREPSLWPTSPTKASYPQPPLAPAADQSSLGASLIANGIVRKPLSASDPLAPIRRMS